MSELQIPCGNCIGCRIDRSQQWTVRLMAEASRNDRRVFLTLTYDPLKLPENNQLIPRDLQLFWKRLRKFAKLPSDQKIKYLACGEYGDKDGRPHYHAILFGVDFHDAVRCGTGKLGDPLYKSETLEKIWTHGLCWIGSVTPQSCGYVARYIMKKITGNMAEQHYQKVNEKTGEIYQQVPEFLRCSKNLGLNLFENFQSDIYPSDNVIIKGKSFPVPKYYDKKLEEKNLELHTAIKKARKKRALKYKKDATPDRLAVREEVKKSKLSQLIRS